MENMKSLGAHAPFTNTDTINIPDAIYDQFNQTETRSDMGIFPEIDRAWITVDNRLYFWNYRNGSDFYSFDQLDQSIVSVALVPPKPGVFVNNISHVLVICTASDLYLIAMTYDSQKNELELYETGMSVSVNGLGALSIAASPESGRLFICGTNHGANISEIVYTNVETWFKGKCNRVCLTPDLLSSFISPFTGYDRHQFEKIPLVGSLLNHSTPETVESIAIDDSRSLLYTLSNSSTIRMYHMNPKSNGLDLRSTYTLSQIVSHTQMISTNTPELGEDVKAVRNGKFAIVSIQVISSVESNRLNLVAITSTGSRIYIKAVNSSGRLSPPSLMQAVQQRYPPTSTATSNPTTPVQNFLNNTSSLSKVFSPGYFFAVIPNRNGEPGNSVFVSAPDSGKVIFQLSTASVGTFPVYSENACFLDVEGFVQQIALIKPYSAPKAGFANESATQFTTQNPQIVILTNNGIKIFTRKFPSQVFEELGEDIKPFFDFYGRTETCANALSIASKTSSYSVEECEFASKVFIAIGGKPRLKVDDEKNVYSFNLVGANTQTPASFGNQSNSVVSSLINSNEEVIRLSGRFDGLATYIARIMRNLWKTKVFNVQSVNNIKRFQHNTGKKALEEIQLALLDVSEYLEKNKTFIDGLSGGPDSLLVSSGRSEELSLQAEHRALHSFVTLIKSMKEGVAFLLLLVDESAKTADGLESITSFLPLETRNKLETLTFQQFFSTKLGNELARELVTCLVNRNISDGGSVDSVSLILQDRCVSFCSADDVIIYKGLEYLRKAESLDGIARQQKLSESLVLFQRAAGNIQYDMLNEALIEFVKLKFYPGAVELALTVAQQEDKSNQALGYFKDGKKENDQRKPFFEARYKIYQLIFKIIETADNDVVGSTTSSFISNGDSNASKLQSLTRLRDETYFVCYSSKEEIFHFCFYDWFVAKGVVNRLMDIETPFILSYLEHKAKTDLQISNLLWSYHEKHGNFYQATTVLFGLAKSDFDLSLSQRIEFLSRAKASCNCPCPQELRSDMATLATLVQEHLDVASLQDEILASVRHDEEFENDKRQEIIDMLNSRLLDVSELFNDYAEPLNYYEIMLQIFKTSDYQGTEEIRECWNALIDKAHSDAIIKGSSGNSEISEPYEYISQIIIKMGQQLGLTQSVFPTGYLVSRLQSYAVENKQGAPLLWVVDTFLQAGVDPQTLVSIYVELLEMRSFPFNDDYNFYQLARVATHFFNNCIANRSLKLSKYIQSSTLDKIQDVLGPESVLQLRSTISNGN